MLGYHELDRAMTLLGRLRADEIRSDITASFSHLRQLGIAASGQGIVGFCMGGSVSLIVATEAECGAAVTFYGGGVAQGRFGFPALADAAPSLRMPWLGLYGDQDHTIPAKQVEALRAQALAPVPAEIIRYAGAGHGFNCNDRASFVPDAAADAWSHTLRWLRLHLTRRSRPTLPRPDMANLNTAGGFISAGPPLRSRRKTLTA